jgi:prepilin-type N-terminal cleavage/methylation domain-containing protein
MIKIENRKSKIENSQAFSLIELLVVITIIGALAALVIVGLGAVKKAQYKHVARIELEAIETALENYKAKYGAYPPSNQNNNNVYAPKGFDRAQFSQLYYELSGTVANNAGYMTLDGVSQISTNDVNTAYGVGGFVNCTRGSGEDAISAKNFIPNLKPKQYYVNVTNNGVLTTILITSVGGPDNKYQPLQWTDMNPIRYLYPGTNNPNSYDLWVQLVIGGKTNLVCNWSRQVIVNSPLP